MKLENKAMLLSIRVETVFLCVRQAISPYNKHRLLQQPQQPQQLQQVQQLQQAQTGATAATSSDRCSSCNKLRQVQQLQQAQTGATAATSSDRCNTEGFTHEMLVGRAHDGDSKFYHVYSFLAC
jgi:hypothetical protein